MDLKQLRQFVVLAEELNFRRAAERLHMTQPPLSVSLQRLEEAVGARLLERSRSLVRLTPAGQAFLAEVRHTLTHIDHSVRLARATAQGSSGVLRIGAIESATLGLLPRALASFRRVHPDVTLTVRTSSSRESALGLRRGEFDVAILVPGVPDMDGVSAQVVHRERFCAVVAREHPLAHRSCIELGELRAESLIALFPHAESPGYASALSNALRREGVQPRIYHADTTIFTKLALVGSGYGVGLVPAAMRSIRPPEVAFVDVVGAHGRPITYDVAVATRADGAPRLAVQFLGHLPDG